jgi:hypothetical protein
MGKLCLLILNFLLVAYFGILGGGTDKIGDINANPEEYEGKDCSVKGFVTAVIDIPFTSKDYFKINDGSGEIWIFTDKGVPPKNIEVKVKGIVKHVGKIPILGTDLGYCIKPQAIEFLK